MLNVRQASNVNKNPGAKTMYAFLLSLKRGWNAGIRWIAICRRMGFGRHVQTQSVSVYNVWMKETVYLGKYAERMSARKTMLDIKEVPGART